LNLIEPISFAGDYRPFFTIHDSSFRSFSNISCPIPPATIVGVTNPFFEKAFEHWPHKLMLGTPATGAAKFSTGNGSNNASPSTSPQQSSASSPQVSPSFTRRTSSIDKKYKRRLLTTTTAFKQTLTVGKESAMLDKLTSRPKSDEEAIHNSYLLRAHFLELTTEFLTPLDTYFSRLLPMSKEISPFRRLPRVKPFKETEFLEFLGSFQKGRVCSKVFETQH
jgi:hypothetical protein